MIVQNTMEFVSLNWPGIIMASSSHGDCSALIVSSLETPFTLIRPATSRRSRVIVTSPHSGRQYPSRFIEQSALELDDLRQVEDAGVDRLLAFQPLPCPIMLAEFPRSFVDLNRDAGEIDHAMFDGPVNSLDQLQSRYLRWGLGVIPSKAANQQNIYSALLPAEEANDRLDHYYTPFHGELGRLLNNASRGGDALLIDCHSMPSRLPGLNADIVIGSDYGKSADADIVREAKVFFEREGLKVALNSPFAGGHITRHYGKPGAGVSAIQVEICRSLYLDENRVRLKSGWQDIASTLCRFIMRMDARMEGSANP